MKQRILRPEHIPLMLLAALFCLSFFFVPGFNQSWLFSTVLKNGSYHGIIALGLLPVLISGDVDLSIGAQMTFYSVLCAVFLKNGYPIPAAVLATLAAAVLVGCIEGAVVARWHFNSILMTIAMSMFLIGLSSALNRGVTIFNLPKQLLAWGDRRLLGVSMPMLFWVLAALVIAFILHQTYWGTFFYAVGHNAQAADKAGVPLLQVKMVAFGLSSLFCAVSSVIYISQLGFAPLSNGQDTTYSVLTIAALGGVSFSGGRGKVTLVLLGGLMIGTLTSLFTLAEVSYYYQNCIKGAILFIAIFTNFSKT